jgi:DNA-binding transcriptional regulator YdaS (Cro superfamily)
MIKEVIDAAGGVKALAAKVGVHRTTVIGWRVAGEIPMHRVLAVSEASGIPPHVLRPDIYPAPFVSHDTAPRDAVSAPG